MDEKLTLKEIRLKLGYSTMKEFAEFLEIEVSSYTRKEKYERGLSAKELRLLVNKVDWLTVNNIVLDLDEIPKEELEFDVYDGF